MLDLEGLRLDISGEYQDVYLYGQYLYLLSDDELRVVNFARLIERVLGQTPEDKVLFRYAFLRNDVFYDQGNALFEFFGLEKIKRVLFESFVNAKRRYIGQRELQRATVAVIPHGHPGVLHLEVYKGSLFVSSERGTYAHRIMSPTELSPEFQLFGFGAVHMSANVGDLVYFSCGHNGLLVADVEGVRRRRDPLRSRDIKEYDERAIATELAYYDFVCRTIDNDYTYRINALRTRDSRTGDYLPEERVAAFDGIDLHDAEEGDVLDGASYVSAYAKRLLRLDVDRVTIFEMDYDSRMSTLPKASDRGSFYQKMTSTPLSDRQRPEAVFGGYQTVFGLVLDTDNGTMVLDDDPSGACPLRTRMISRGENVKVRHYYRSRNYSHLVISIKNTRVEIFADLTNYFFPRRHKTIRVLRPFGKSGSGALFSELPFSDEEQEA